MKRVIIEQSSSMLLGLVIMTIPAISNIEIHNVEFILECVGVCLIISYLIAIISKVYIDVRRKDILLLIYEQDIDVRYVITGILSFMVGGLMFVFHSDLSEYQIVTVGNLLPIGITFGAWLLNTIMLLVYTIKILLLKSKDKLKE